MLPLVVALALAQLVSVPAPNGGAVQADPALRLAMDLLASLEDGRPLVQAFADGGVRLLVAPVADLGRLALYEPRRRAVTVPAEAARMAPRTVATILAHEATHVQS